MTNLHEAAQQALEALEYADACLKKQLTTKTKHEYAQDLLFAAGTALRAALAEPVQEPVAWVEAPYGEIRANPLYRLQVPQSLALSIPLYAAPPQRKPLTDAEIERACVPLGAAMLSFTEVARAIERAHGIKTS